MLIFQNFPISSHPIVYLVTIHWLNIVESKNLRTDIVLAPWLIHAFLPLPWRPFRQREREGECRSVGKCIILQSDNSHAGGSHREPKCTKTLSGNKKHNFECFFSLHSPQTAKPFGSIKIKSQLLLDCQLVERLLRRDKNFSWPSTWKDIPPFPRPLTQDVTILHYRLCPTWWPAHLGFNIVSPPHNYPPPNSCPNRPKFGNV